MSFMSLAALTLRSANTYPLAIPSGDVSMLRSYLTLAVLCASLSACDAAQYQALKVYMAVKKGLNVDDGAIQMESPAQNFEIVSLIDDMSFPWGMAFLPDGRLLITEKPGYLRLFDLNSQQSEMISGVPVVFYDGQGGLLDVVAHPEFEKNRWIYLSASVELGTDLRTTRVYRYRLQDAQLKDELLIFEAVPAGPAKKHFGCALLFDNAGYLFATMGDRGQREFAQDLGTTLGKVLRFNDDGSIPADNPFIDVANADPAIYSYGHRNPQGITIDRATDRIWVSEHGPQGGDEINLLKAGGNYGWPVITYGEEYGGGKIGEGTSKPGMEQPIHYYVPSIATANLAYYDGKALAAWDNSLFVAGLRSFSLSRVQLEGDEAVSEERLLEDFGFRLRGVEQGPDGLLYLLSENGGLLQLRPWSD